MGSKKPTASREMLRPDARYNSKLVSKFINCMMWDGKKSIATRIFYAAMNDIARRTNVRDNSGAEVDVFKQAVDNVKPAVEIKSKRVGGATYQVPVRVESVRQQALSIRWIIQAARAKKGRPMFLRLADELLAASRREGEAFTKRENVHRMADANKAFAHFAH
jgi:small subunit ribosomal protein S7